MKIIQIFLILSSFFFLSNLNASEKGPPTESPDQHKSRFEQLELFNKVLFLVENQYYRPVDTKKLIEGALKGMMEALDPHSSFLNKELYEKMQAETSGEFGGLGIEVTLKDNHIMVVAPIEDTPAFKAGIKSKDRIIEIDRESVMGLSLDEAIKKMKGGPNTKVELGIVRKGEESVLYVPIVRKIIKVKPVKSFLLEDNIIYLRLVQFQKNAHEELSKAIIKTKSEMKGKPSGIILDLRSNPGGLLDEAIEVSSLFLKEGIVVSTEGREGGKKEIFSVVNKGPKELELPIVVLINGSSASASEIVAGALQDHKRAIILGSQSFGKGSVQTVAKVDEDNGVKLTIAQYMTPSGRKIQNVGIKVDVELEDLDQNWVESNRKSLSLKESDLKNHLSATIETVEEKNMRLEREKLDRKNRIDEIEKQKRKVKSSSESLNGKDAEGDDETVISSYNPSEDYQVLQSVKFLKSYSTIKNLKL
jgi:carboxyl-terminal processing protease